MTTPCEAYYLEMGVLPISVLLRARRITYLHCILNRDKKSMLYSFFTTRWHNPCKGDWTEQIKEDLAELKIPCSFNDIQNKSKESFKRYVKIKAKELALKNLLSKKEGHSKMEKLTYRDLNIQPYFLSEDIGINQKRSVFKYRVRMERFGENFRGRQSQVICPLCKLHLDNQEMGFQCPEIKKEIEINGSIDEIYIGEIKKETIKTMTKILEIRKE